MYCLWLREIEARDSSLLCVMCVDPCVVCVFWAEEEAVSGVYVYISWFLYV